MKVDMYNVRMTQKIWCTAMQVYVSVYINKIIIMITDKPQASVIPTNVKTIEMYIQDYWIEYKKKKKNICVGCEPHWGFD